MNDFLKFLIYAKLHFYIFLSKQIKLYMFYKTLSKWKYSDQILDLWKVEIYIFWQFFSLYIV